MWTIEDNKWLAEQVGLSLEFDEMDFSSEPDQDYIHGLLIEMSIPPEADSEEDLEVD
jgi:hypothetical protein